MSPPDAYAHPGVGSGPMATGGAAVRRPVIPFVRAVYEIARKEVLMFVRTKRLYVMGGLYALGFLALTISIASALNGFLGEGFDEVFGGEGASVCPRRTWSWPSRSSCRSSGRSRSSTSWGSSSRSTGSCANTRTEASS